MEGGGRDCQRFRGSASSAIGQRVSDTIECLCEVHPPGGLGHSLLLSSPRKGESSDKAPVIQPEEDENGSLPSIVTILGFTCSWFRYMRK